MSIWVSKAITYNKTLVDAVVSAFKTVPAGPLFATRSLRLFTNDFTPSPLSLIADFTEANFSGYTALGLFIGGPVNFSSDQSAMTGGGAYTAATATPFVPNVCFGWFFCDTGGTDWYAAERFDTPVPFAAVGDFLTLSLAFPMPYDQSTFN